MTHISKITKAELAATVDALSRELDQAQTEASSALEKLRGITVPVKVPEADALAGCVRALSGIPASPPLNSWSSSNTNQLPDIGTIRRVLVSLADRYGIPLIEQTTVPCSRPHLDDYDVQQRVAQALTGWS